MINYTDNTNQLIQVTNHTFTTEQGETKVNNMTIPVGHRLWFEYGLDKLAQADQIEAYQAPIISADELMAQIDNTAAQITANWTRFADEYKEREAVALEHKNAQYKGTPNSYVTSFSQSAKVTTKKACELILTQAEKLRSAQAELAEQRMRKHELKAEELSAEQKQTLCDDIIQAMQAIAAEHQ